MPVSKTVVMTLLDGDGVVTGVNGLVGGGVSARMVFVVVRDEVLLATENKTQNMVHLTVLLYIIIIIIAL